MGRFDKQLQDYKITEERDERGKRRTYLDYIGNYYYFNNKEAALASKPMIIGCSILGLVLYFALLSIRITVLRTPYVSIPFVFTGIPMITLVQGVWTLWTKKEPYYHKESDNITFKIPVSGGFILALQGVSFIAAIVALIVGRDNAGDPIVFDFNNAVFFGGCLIYAMTGYILLSKRKILDMRGNIPTEDEKRREKEKSRR